MPVPMMRPMLRILLAFDSVDQMLDSLHQERCAHQAQMSAHAASGVFIEARFPGLEYFLGSRLCISSTGVTKHSFVD